MSQSRSRIASLDGLRGFSIWTVLLGHAARHYGWTPFGSQFLPIVLATMSYFGVTVFFVISGFLITRLLMQEREKTSAISLRAFYARRAVRILPAFLLYTLVILFLGHPTIPQQLYAFTFTTSYFFDQAYRPLQQLWSLSVEEQFYLLWPLLMMRGAITGRRACWAAFLLCPILRFALKSMGYHEFGTLAPAIMDSIAAGCLFAIEYDRIRALCRAHLCSTRRFVAAVVGTMAFAGIVYRGGLTLLWGIVPCLVVMVIAAAIERKDAVLNRGPLVWSGILSYSLYLWQQPFLTLDGPLNSIWLRLPMAFAVALFSYRFVEQPVLRLFGARLRSVPASRSATPLPQES